MVDRKGRRHCFAAERVLCVLCLYITAIHCAGIAVNNRATSDLDCALRIEPGTVPVGRVEADAIYCNGAPVVSGILRNSIIYTDYAITVSISNIFVGHYLTTLVNQGDI